MVEVIEESIAERRDDSRRQDNRGNERNLRESNRGNREGCRRRNDSGKRENQECRKKSKSSRKPRGLPGKKGHSYQQRDRRNIPFKTNQ